MEDQNKEAWLGSSISELCNNKGPWSFSVVPVQASKYHAVMYNLPVNLKDLPTPHKNSDPKHWDDDHVRMPYSDKNLFPVTENGVDVIRLRWKIIKENLLKPINNSYELESAISSYNSSLPKLTILHSYFKDMDDDTSCHFFQDLLPKIISLALDLPKLIPGSLPLLKKNHNRSISLSQQQIGSLLANAFLCTFPWRKHTASSYPGVNFISLFIADKRANRRNSKEKLSCIFNYFRIITKSIPVGVVTFERKYIPKANIPRWDTAKNIIKDTKVHIDSTGTIEDNGLGFLQVDFANKYIGGGVLGYGCVQEEIRFVICPELIVSRLFIEQLTDLEAVIITGVQRYSKYTGYAETFAWDGPFHDDTPYDEYGRRKTTICAIDATYFTYQKQQFPPSIMLRELNKAYVGFSSRNMMNLAPVATGNWGCGAFNGSPYLKAVLQLMACSVTGRNLVYYTFGNEEFKNDFYKMYLFLTNNNIKVDQLWNFLSCFSKSHSEESKLYPFIQQAFFDSKKQEVCNKTISDLFKKKPAPIFFSKLNSKVAACGAKDSYKNDDEINNDAGPSTPSSQDKAPSDSVVINMEVTNTDNDSYVIPGTPEDTSYKKIKDVVSKLPTTDIGSIIDEIDGGTMPKSEQPVESFLDQVHKFSKNDIHKMEVDVVSTVKDHSMEPKAKRKISEYFQKEKRPS